MHKLAEDESELFPIVSKIILHDFYVDDLFTDASTLQEVLEIKRQTIELFKKNGFELTKWSSNHAFLQDVEGSHKKEFNLSDHNNQIRALGVSWNCDVDIIKFIGIRQHPLLQRPTKRTIIQNSLDIRPFRIVKAVIIAKLLIQEL